MNVRFVGSLLLSTALATCAFAAPSKSKGSPEPALSEQGNANLVAKGKNAYMAKCQSCHGLMGNGDGPASRALPRKPADWSKTAFWSEMTDKQFSQAIISGRPGTPMRPQKLLPAQLKAIMAYVQTFKPAN